MGGVRISNAPASNLEMPNTKPLPSDQPNIATSGYVFDDDSDRVKDEFSELKSRSEERGAWDCLNIE